MSEVALFFEKMHKVFKNKAQRCSTPLSYPSTHCNKTNYHLFMYGIYIFCLFYLQFRLQALIVKMRLGQLGPFEQVMVIVVLFIWHCLLCFYIGHCIYEKWPIINFFDKMGSKVIEGHWRSISIQGCHSSWSKFPEILDNFLEKYISYSFVQKLSEKKILKIYTFNTIS